MNIVERIKAEQLTARKNKDEVAKNLLTTLLGEIENLSKQPKVQVGFEFQIIRKFLNNVEMYQKMDVGVDRLAVLKREHDILTSLLPSMVSREELVTVIREILPEGKMTPKDRGVVMKTLKERYQERLDSALVMTICKEQFEI